MELNEIHLCRVKYNLQLQFNNVEYNRIKYYRLEFNPFARNHMHRKKLNEIYLCCMEFNSKFNEFLYFSLKISIPPNGIQ